MNLHKLIRDTRAGGSPEQQKTLHQLEVDLDLLRSRVEREQQKEADAQQAIRDWHKEDKERTEQAILHKAQDLASAGYPLPEAMRRTLSGSPAEMRQQAATLWQERHAFIEAENRREQAEHAEATRAHRVVTHSTF